MKISDIIEKFGSIIFLDAETEIVIAWDGGVHFEILAGRFNGEYDAIDAFYKKVETLQGAKIAAQSWFEEHSRFNPGP